MAIVSLNLAEINNAMRTPGASLGVSQFSFSVPILASVWTAYGPGSEPFSNYGVLSAAQAAHFRSAMALWDALIIPNFTEISESGGSAGEIRLAFTTAPLGTGYAYSGSPQPAGGRVGDIWIDHRQASEDFAPGLANGLYETMLHEIGHTLGLKHPFETPVIPAPFDNQRFTVMSYEQPGNAISFSGSANSIQSFIASAAAITPMVLDIAAVQAIYGASTTTRADNTVYRFDQELAVVQSVFDSGGIDTFDLSNFTRSSFIDLRPGAYSSIGRFSRAEQISFWTARFPNFAAFITSTINAETDLFTFTDNVGIALNVTIENAIGGLAADEIIGNAAANLIDGGAGDDIIDGGSGDDQLLGGGGNDRLIGGLGSDKLDGGEGFDYASYVNATSGMLADLVVWTLNIGEAAGDAYANIEGILGSAFNDDLRGTGGDNWIYGGSGSDIAYGRGGNDVLLGEGGDDILWGNEGNDALYGGEGLDRLLGGAGADLLNGEGGFDFAHYDDATSGITVDLASNAFNAGGALGDQLFNVEGLVGSFFNDRLLGDGITNWLYGADGDDVLDGRGGDDVLIAGNGNDVMFGGDGNDLMFGEIGDDTLVGGAGNDRMDGGAGADVLNGGAGADVLIGNLGFDYVSYDGAAAGVTADMVAWGNNTGEAAGDSLIEVEGIIGSAFADSLRGDIAGNFLYGLAGADFLFGRGGNDVLIGGDGDDTLFGNEGDDAIYGGAGNDRIVFGAGDGRDAVFEFAAGAGVGDAIQLASSLGITSFAQLQGRMTQVGGDTLISFDAATSLTIVGVAPGALAANDFIFG